MRANVWTPNVVSANPSQFMDLKRIIIYNTCRLWRDATGHTTLWNGSKRLGGNYSHSYFFK